MKRFIKWLFPRDGFVQACLMFKGDSKYPDIAKDDMYRGAIVWILIIFGIIIIYYINSVV